MTTRDRVLDLMTNGGRESWTTRMVADELEISEPTARSAFNKLLADDVIECTVDNPLRPGRTGANRFWLLTAARRRQREKDRVAMEKILAEALVPKPWWSDPATDDQISYIHTVLELRTGFDAAQVAVIGIKMLDKVLTKKEAKDFLDMARNLPWRKS